MAVRADCKHEQAAVNRSGLHFAWGKRLPVWLQSAVTECGQTCLAMILNYHGHEIDLVTLRQRYPLVK